MKYSFKYFFYKPKLVSLIVLIVTFSLLSFMMFQINTLEREQEEAKAYTAAADYGFLIKSTIDQSLASTHTLAALVIQNKGVIADFEAIAQDILPYYPAIKELAIAPQGIIQRVAPLYGNEKAIGLNLFEAKIQKNEALFARENKILTLAGPHELVQGGVGLVGRLPIFLADVTQEKDHFWGFTLAVLSLEHLVNQTNREKLESNYAYEIWRINPATNSKQTILASKVLPKNNAIFYEFEVPNGIWTITMAPLDGWGSGGVSFMMRMIGAFIFSLTLATVAHLLINLRQIKRKLERKVLETTDKSQQLKRQLDTLLYAIPDLVWLKDLEGRYLFCNRSFEQLFGFREAEIIGNTDYEFVDIKSADFFRTHDMMVMSSKKEMVYEEELIFKGNHYQGLFEVVKTPFYNEKHTLIGVLGIARDITKRRENEQRIEVLESFDSLTGLPNKTMLRSHVEHDISIAKRKQESLAILFLDADHFKHINDTLGHGVGDTLLIEVAKRLKQALRQEDTLSRQGGDEFVIVLPGIKADGAAHVAKKLLSAIEEPIKLDTHELVITASIGISMYPSDGVDMETLFKCADAAMYLAKQNGRNNYRFYTAEIQAHSSRVLMLENALRYAHMRGELSLHYQPQISLKSGKIIGLEALLRWKHPELGDISPSEFIPIAEESGQILLIGEWVLRTASNRMKQWIDMGFGVMPIAVNLSAVQFHHEHLSALVETVINEARLPASCLELELTESVAAQNPERAIETMNILADKGIRLSIDDFGTGYSSLSYLKRFRVHKLKIDQSFIRDILQDDDDKAIVSTIITLAKSLGLKTIAEGVESKEHVDFLVEQGCDEAQGYYFSKPLCVEACETFMRERI